ncbi:hypothetical protein [Methanoregula sp.]|uniref:hypothetical protein n=1 Tax=Methanoregula sp. TaxID=2052170 RepID=UPI003BAEFA71
MARKLEKNKRDQQASQITIVKPEILTRLICPKTRTFFGREIFFAGKFLARKLKIAKKFGLKVFRPSFFRFET